MSQRGANSDTTARRRFRIVVLFAATLLLIEVGLRSVLGNFAITDLYEYEPADGRCAGLKPGAEADYTGWLFRIPPVRLAVNEDGYRGPRRPRDKDDGTYRILLLGDSYAFGQAVPESGTVSAQLEETLASCSGRRVEVLNFGVSGLNVEEIVDQYILFASKWAHDLVLYVAVDNDLDGAMCRAQRSHEILDSRLFQALNQNVYISRALYILFVLAATNEKSVRPPLERLQAAEESLTGQAGRSGADLGILMLSDPMQKQIDGAFWAPGSPLVDVSHLLASPHVVPGEFHLDEEGYRILATEVAPWIRTQFCEDPGPDAMGPR